jgi:hypothetical protein
VVLLEAPSKDARPALHDNEFFPGLLAAWGCSVGRDLASLAGVWRKVFHILELELAATDG